MKRIYNYLLKFVEQILNFIKTESFHMYLSSLLQVKPFFRYTQNNIQRSLTLNSEEFIDDASDTVVNTEIPITYIAFYLPQFHPIPENDAWWGKNFTEWANVTRAAALFPEHYQPHLPAHFGFYDLRIPSIIAEQAELAKKYGVKAFCFYLYWFSGTPLLTIPLTHFLENDNIDLEFCLCWANENWTRRWDGRDEDILIQQEYRKDDPEQFIIYIEKYLNDRRYITINGKKVLLIYRITSIPDVRGFTAQLRSVCKNRGIGELYLVAVKSYDFVEKDPAQYGMDAFVEFPPHTIRRNHPTPINSEVALLTKNYHGIVYSYHEIIKKKLYFAQNKPSYQVFQGIMTAWDNTPRKPTMSTIFHNSNPTLFGQWLFAISRYTMEQNSAETRLVFINAWNEWAEGAHLEPDRRYGYGYLREVLRCIHKINSDNDNYSPSKK